MVFFIIRDIDIDESVGIFHYILPVAVAVFAEDHINYPHTHGSVEVEYLAHLCERTKNQPVHEGMQFFERRLIGQRGIPGENEQPEVYRRRVTVVFPAEIGLQGEIFFILCGCP